MHFSSRLPKSGFLRRTRVGGVKLYYDGVHFGLFSRDAANTNKYTKPRRGRQNSSLNANSCRAKLAAISFVTLTHWREPKIIIRRIYPYLIVDTGGASDTVAFIVQHVGNPRIRLSREKKNINSRDGRVSNGYIFSARMFRVNVCLARVFCATFAKIFKLQLAYARSVLELSKSIDTRARIRGVAKTA